MVVNGFKFVEGGLAGAVAGATAATCCGCGPVTKLVGAVVGFSTGFFLDLSYKFLVSGRAVPNRNNPIEMNNESSVQVKLEDRQFKKLKGSQDQDEKPLEEIERLKDLIRVRGTNDIFQQFHSLLESLFSQTF